MKRIESNEIEMKTGKARQRQAQADERKNKMKLKRGGNAKIVVLEHKFKPLNALMIY